MRSFSCGTPLKALIAATHMLDAQRVVHALDHTTNVETARRVVGLEEVGSELQAHRGTETVVVFFCGGSFHQHEARLLEQLCSSVAERVRIIAVGRVDDPARVLEIIRRGACDFLHLEQQFAESLVAVIKRVRLQERSRYQTGKLFAVVSPAGGTGASVLACNLATATALREGTCGLIDLRMRGGDQAQLFNVTPNHCLTSLIAKGSQLDASMFEQSLTVHSGGVHLLAGPDPYVDSHPFGFEAIRRVLDFARDKFSHVFLDFDAPGPMDALRVLAGCDRILVVIRPDYVALSRCKRYLASLSHGKIDPAQVLVVANRTGQPRELPIAYMREALGRDVSYCIPNDPVIVSESYNLGIPLVAANGTSQRCGVVALESVATLSGLLLMLFFTFDVGLAVVRYNMLAAAVRSVARQAIVRGEKSSPQFVPWGPTAVEGTAGDATAQAAAAAPLLATMNPADVRIVATWPDGDCRVGHRVKITATYVHVPRVPFLNFGGAFNLRAECTMRIVH